MSSITNQNSLVETAYEVAKHIQSHVTENPQDGTGKPWNIYSADFKAGPDASYNQTKKGLFLDETPGGMPSRIHSPLGTLAVLGYGITDRNIMEAIKKPLGLKLIWEGVQGSRWAITKWKDQTIEQPEFRDSKDYISSKDVRKIWSDFANHKELNSK